MANTRKANKPCICKNGNGNWSGKWIGCSNKHCRIEWFHVDCVKPKSTRGSWLCKQCEKLSDEDVEILPEDTEQEEEKEEKEEQGIEGQDKIEVSSEEEDEYRTAGSDHQAYVEDGEKEE